MRERSIDKGGRERKRKIDNDFYIYMTRKGT